MRTRTKPATKGGASSQTTANELKTIALSPPDAEPPKVTVLPKDLSDDARIVSLPDPATSTLKRYLVCPKHGFYEFTKVAAPKTTPKSWLLRPSDRQDEADKSNDSIGEGYLVKDADLLIATPVDAGLLLLPALAPLATENKQMFLAFDDHLDAWAASSPHAKVLAADNAVREHLEAGIASLCDAVDAGEEKMYRLSSTKLVQQLLQKAERASTVGMPKSMEEHFVKDGLKAPFVSVAISDTTSKTDAAESQDSIDSGYVSSTPGTDEMNGAAVATPTQLTPSDEVYRLQRLRTAVNFIMSSYVPPRLQDWVRQQLSATKSFDFTPLDAYLLRIEELKKQSQALRNISENISRKRAADEDDEAAEARAEKKRKKEEEDAKKKSETRALKQLKKADTSGMKKLSSFFTKKPA